MTNVAWANGGLQVDLHRQLFSMPQAVMCYRFFFPRCYFDYVVSLLSFVVCCFSFFFVFTFSSDMCLGVVLGPNGLLSLLSHKSRYSVRAVRIS